jgi:hypothetical protein
MTTANTTLIITTTVHDKAAQRVAQALERCTALNTSCTDNGHRECVVSVLASTHYCTGDALTRTQALTLTLRECAVLAIRHSGV